MVNAFLCCSFKYFHILGVWLAIFEYLGRSGALHSSPLMMRHSSTELTPLWQLYFCPWNLHLCQEWNSWPSWASGGPWATDSLCWAIQRLCFSTTSSFSAISVKIYSISIAIEKAIPALFPMPAASYPHIISSLVLSQPPVSCTTKDLRSEVG